jgi:hypothetical protein
MRIIFFALGFVCARFVSAGSERESNCGQVRDVLPLGPRGERRLGAAEIDARVVAHGRESYSVLYSVMKGVSVGLTVLAISWLAREGGSGLPRLPLLAASFAAVVLTYVGTTIGSNLLPARFGVPDALLPLVLSVAEGWPLLLLTSNDDTRHVAHVWMLSMAIYTFLIAGLLAWIRQRMQERFYETVAMDDLIVPYRRRLAVDASAAALTGLVLLACFVVAQEEVFSLSTWAETGFAGGVATISLIGGLVTQERIAAELRSNLGRALRQAG